MQVLIVGNGGREHTLAWKVAQSAFVERVFVAPGNVGTANCPKCQNVAIAATAIAELIDFAMQQAIDLCIVGPEAPLALGLVDQCQLAAIPCFGPTQLAAQLESSKSFSKAFMQRHGIPTANYAEFSNRDAALAYLESCEMPLVIKADGLAAGKGVIIAHDKAQAEQAVRTMLEDKKFGDAAGKIIIEDFLDGVEASFIVMTDGHTCIPLASSQDHKRLLDDDQGPNTGGMGAYSPAPMVTTEIEQQVMARIIQPTIAGMAQDGIPYQGFLYAGLMIDKHGDVKVLEFNCRLGDPETQVLLPRLQSDLTELCLASLNGSLYQQSATWDPRPALGVVVASPGYPEAYPKGLNLPLPTTTELGDDVLCFHAGTAVNAQQQLTSNGGRIVCLTALADILALAQSKAYDCLDSYDLGEFFYRRDIGAKALSAPPS